ncbi:hypothetical protein BC628DRAFT_1462070 [Trametes gibbosa]|nr:hypothetical protein BC628DRAFT_1462070 [Trametes gibbosa]
MSGDEGEYVVGQFIVAFHRVQEVTYLCSPPLESILSAQVVKKKGRKTWLYWVKWKNYGFDDNTWEPIESFAGGSEHFIEHFWARVDTDGRDHSSLGEFHVGEEFLPSGPPRRKKAKKAAEAVEVIEISSSPSPVQNADSENEVRSIIGDDEDEPAVVTTRGKRRRSSAGADAESLPIKRKRGRPPGKRAAQMEEATKVATRRKSLPEIPRTNRGRVQVAESSSAARGPSATRTRGLPRKSAAPFRPSSSSPDELLLRSEANGKSSLSPVKKKRNAKSLAKVAADDGDSTSQDAVEASAMIVDDSEDEPSTFGKPSLLASESIPEPVSQPGPSTSMPAHRARAANPRVKVVDDPNLTVSSGALSVKSRFMKRAAVENEDGGSPARSARVLKGKAGPGRPSSSLVVGGSRLVAHKGTLTVVRSKAGPSRTKASNEMSHAEQNEVDSAGAQNGLIDDPAEADDVPGLGQHGMTPKPPPTGEELLKEAGMNPLDGKDLPDFEEDADGEYEVEIIEEAPQPQVVKPQPSQRLQLNAVGAPLETTTEEVGDKAPEKPPVILEARPLTFATRVTSAWSQSTIFGPLSSAPKRYILNVNLASAVSLPVMLKDTRATTTFLEKIDANARNPTGKFYKDQAAISLVNTVDPQTSYARVALSDGATDEQKQHFDRFVARIVAGELFLQVNRFEPLVLCASENSILCQKLGVPAPLQGLVGTVVLIHVSIVDYSAYVDATEHADNSRW